MSKSLKIGIGVVLSLLIIAALFLFYVLDPESHQIFPKCPFLMFTGLECPGCGSQRAIHHLLHLNIADAFRYNAFMVLAIPYVSLGVYMEYFGGKVRQPKLQKIFFGRWSALVVLFLILAYWILRNL